jgi:hypothetical protein
LRNLKKPHQQERSVMSSDTNDNVTRWSARTGNFETETLKKDLDLLANRVCMTVAFIHFISEVTNVSTNNQLAG